MAKISANGIKEELNYTVRRNENADSKEEGQLVFKEYKQVRHASPERKKTWKE